MFHQLFIGTLVSLGSVVFGSVMWWILIHILHRLEPWYRNPPYFAKSVGTMFVIVSWTMVIMTFGVWLWALVLIQLQTFQTMEEAVYYALVAYTTLGLSDAELPREWRLLGGMTGANGFLMFGLLTAMLTDALRDLRRIRSPRGPHIN